MPLSISQLSKEGSDPSSTLKPLPYFNIELDSEWFDALEYFMGLQRSGLETSDLRFTVSLQVQQEFIDAFLQSEWALVPDDEVLKAILDLFWNNYDSKADARKSYDSVVKVLVIMPNSIL